MRRCAGVYLPHRVADAMIADARGGVVYALRKSCEKAADIVVPDGSGHLISAAPYGPGSFAFLTSTGKVLLY